MTRLNQKVDNNFSLSCNQKIQYQYSIFNDPKFISLHSQNYVKLFSYFLIEDKTKSCRGVITFGKDSYNNLRSPLNGSFGGFQFSKNIYFETKEKFINLVLNDLENLNPNTIEITLPPDIYNLENNTYQLSTLLRNKFLIEKIEINQYIDLDNYDFNKSIKSGNKKNIKKCIRENIQFKELDSNQNELAYKIIESNRIRRKYNISMSWEDLNKMIKEFPDNFLNFGLFSQEEMIAAAICIKISEEILYVFYWGEIETYQKISPVSFLSYKIASYCKLKKIKILDLGTSSHNSVPNLGLINFKKSIGALCCNKLKLIKTFPKNNLNKIN